MEWFLLVMFLVMGAVAVGGTWAQNRERRRIAELVDHHRDMLAANRRECRTDYGTFDDRAWEGELVLFIDGVLRPHLLLGRSWFENGHRRNELIRQVDAAFHGPAPK